MLTVWQHCARAPKPYDFLVLGWSGSRSCLFMNATRTGLEKIYEQGRPVLQQYFLSYFQFCTVPIILKL